MNTTADAQRNCIECGKTLPKNRTKLRKFCSDTCRLKHHGAARLNAVNASTGANALASQGPAIQAAWGDLHDLVKKHAPLFRLILDGEGSNKIAAE